MKIFYLANTIYNSGGMERVLISKANALTERYGYEVVIVTNHQKGRPSFFKIGSKVRHIDLNVNTHLPFTMPLYLRRLRQLIAVEKPDICISLCYSDLFYLKDLHFPGIKMAEFHFSHDTYLIKGQRCKLHRMEKAVQGLDCFVVLTQEDKAAWAPYCEHLVQIYNPSTFPTGGPRASLEAKRFISGGRFEKQKNYKDMVLVWQKVHQKHPDWVLDLYGNGKKKASVERLVKALGLQDVIHLHPATGQMKEEMLGASGYLMTSLYEGFPMVMIESAALGLPCVSYRCPCGPAEFIENGINGFTAAAGDIDALATCVCQLIENKALRLQMGERLYGQAADYAEDKIIARWDELFHRLLPDRFNF